MVVVDEAEIIEKGRLGPGQMIAVDLDEGRLYHDGELKDLLASQRPFKSWVGNITSLEALLGTVTSEPSVMDRETLRARQVSCGMPMEDLELILHPMVEDGKEAIGSMGDASPLSVLSSSYRGMHVYFRQNFSQVTNPPIDSLREARVMSLRTR